MTGQILIGKKKGRGEGFKIGRIKMRAYSPQTPGVLFDRINHRVMCLILSKSLRKKPIGFCSIKKAYTLRCSPTQECRLPNKINELLFCPTDRADIVGHSFIPCFGINYPVIHCFVGGFIKMIPMFSNTIGKVSKDVIQIIGITII